MVQDRGQMARLRLWFIVLCLTESLILYSGLTAIRHDFSVATRASIARESPTSANIEALRLAKERARSIRAVEFRVWVLLLIANAGALATVGWLLVRRAPSVDLTSGSRILKV
jgi:hypothetical protein